MFLSEDAGNGGLQRVRIRQLLPYDLVKAAFGAWCSEGPSALPTLGISPKTVMFGTQDRRKKCSFETNLHSGQIQKTVGK